MVAFPGMPKSGAYNVTRSGASYILVNFYTGSREVAGHLADEGSLQKLVGLFLPFFKMTVMVLKRLGRKFMTRKNLPPEKLPSRPHQSRVASDTVSGLAMP